MQVTVIGVDLAKNVFQVHGAAADGTAVLRKKLSRTQFREFMAKQPSCHGGLRNSPLLGPRDDQDGT